MASPERITIQARGLLPEPNDWQAGAGAMRTAQNVSCGRRGLVSPRTGFNKAPTSEVADDDPIGPPPFVRPPTARPVTIIPYTDANGDHDLLIVSRVSSSLYRAELASQGAFLATDFGYYINRSETARGSLYLTAPFFYNLPIKLESTSASDTSTIGALAPDIKSASGVIPGAPDVGWLTPGNAVAYRVVLNATDANDVPRRSPPSSRFIFDPDPPLASPAFVLLDGFIPPQALEGDVIEVYRSVQTAASPTDQLQLTGEVTLSAADIAAGIWTYQDELADDGLGAFLYTNPGQLGIERAYFRPPRCGDVAWYGGVMWYARITEIHRWPGTLLDVGSVGPYYNVTGLQVRGFTGDVALGSPTISNVSSFTGLVVGMALRDLGGDYWLPGTYFQPNTVIQAIDVGAMTITMTANAVANGIGISITAADWVEVDGGRFFADGGNDFTTYRKFGLSTATDATSRAIETIGNLITVHNAHVTEGGNPLGLRTWGVANEVQSGPALAGGGVTSEARAGEFLFESVPNDDLFELTTTRPDAFDPPLGGPFGPGVASIASELPNVAAYSAPGLPESVPLVNRTGDQIPTSATILRIVPLRDALIFFTTEGIYRLSGTAPDGWIIDGLDLDVRLLGTEALTTLNNAIYAFTDRGVVLVTEASVALLTEDTIKTLLEPYIALWQRGDLPTSALTASAHPRRSEILLTLPDSQGDLESDTAYVLDTAHGTWTEWTLRSRCVVYDPDRDAWYFGRGSLEVDRWEIRKERNSGTPDDFADGEHNFLADVSGFKAQIDKALVPGWLPQAGDYYSDPTFGLYRITQVAEVIGPPDFWILTLILDGDEEQEPTQGAGVEAKGFEVIRCVIQWQPIAGRTPVEAVRWLEGAVHLQDVDAQAALRLTAGGSNERIAAPQTVDWLARESDFSDLSRFIPPRAIHRSTRLYAYLEIAVARSAWNVQALSFRYRPTTTRAGRRSAK